MGNLLCSPDDALVLAAAPCSFASFGTELLLVRLLMLQLPKNNEMDDAESSVETFRYLLDFSIYFFPIYT